MNQSFILAGINICTEKSILTNAFIEIQNGIISRISEQPIKGEKIISLPKNTMLIPGMIDLHIHGTHGHDVMDGTLDCLNKISIGLASEGTTGFLATTMAASLTKMEQVLYTVNLAMLKNEGAELLGVHLEGPFLSSLKAGAQQKNYLLPPTIETIKILNKIAPLKLVTLAPELPHAIDLIQYLKEQSIVISMGHTNATFEESQIAIDAGCSHATHLFNAMRPMCHREPGVIGAVLASEEVTAEIIADGIHVHPAMINFAYKIKGKNHLVLVTDAMRGKCMPEGMYELGGQSVKVKKNVVCLKDGTLAGSTLKMSHALKNMMKFTRCDLVEAVQMASFNPAKILNLSHKKGSIACGKDADLVVLDDELNVLLTFVQGRVVYQAAESLAHIL